VIGDAEPVGMCGSGLVDCVAELVAAGLLDHSGRFASDEVAAEVAPGMADRLTYVGKERVFVMHWRGSDPADSVYLSQRDVRELQFAKASIATGWAILLDELGAKPEDVSQVLLAGSFGAYLSPASAVRIGLVPRMALPISGREKARPPSPWSSTTARRCSTPSGRRTTRVSGRLGTATPRTSRSNVVTKTVSPER